MNECYRAACVVCAAAHAQRDLAIRWLRDAHSLRRVQIEEGRSHLATVARLILDMRTRAVQLRELVQRNTARQQRKATQSKLRRQDCNVGQKNLASRLVKRAMCTRRRSCIH